MEEKKVRYKKKKKKNFFSRDLNELLALTNSAYILRTHTHTETLLFIGDDEDDNLKFSFSPMLAKMGSS